MSGRRGVAALLLALAGCVGDFPAPGARAGAGDAGPDRTDATASPPADAAASPIDARRPPGRRDAAPPSDAGAPPDPNDGGPPSADASAPPAPDAAAADGHVPPDAAAADAAPLEPDAAVCDPVPESCNGLDDDCDGAVDEDGVCAPWLSVHCRVWLGWADLLRGPLGASVTWGDCPGADRATSGDVRCASTRGDGRFRTLPLGGTVDANDQLGVAFTCDDPQRPELAAWTQAHCAVYLGHADFNQGPLDAPEWGSCPQAIEGPGPLRCTSSGFDGRFRAMTLSGNVNGDDDLAIAFVCRDAARPARAASVQASVEVFLAWRRFQIIGYEGAVGWGDCPERPRDGDGDTRCVSSLGDGGFHRMDLEGDVDHFDMLGIALLPRREGR